MLEGAVEAAPGAGGERGRAVCECVKGAGCEAQGCVGDGGQVGGYFGEELGGEGGEGWGGHLGVDWVGGVEGLLGLRDCGLFCGGGFVKEVEWA